MTTIYENGIRRDATAAEKATPTDHTAPYTGCPVFIIHKGFKFWCQNGDQPEGHVHNG